MSLLRRRWLAGVACACALFAPGAAHALAPHITHHELRVDLDPDTHWLNATDRLQVTWNPGGGQPLNFLLTNALKIESVTAADGTPLDWSLSAALHGRQQVTVLLPPDAARQMTVQVTYRGAIADDVQKADGLSFVAGDRTEGIIAPEGIYLSGSTSWIPASPDELATYRVSVTVPEGWAVCTQGRFLGTSGDTGGTRTEWVTLVPSDGLALVAGRYVVERRLVEGTTIATYLFPDHADASEQLIRAAADHLATFSDLLGPYPFPEFAIVENFFSSGYAFPGFTLLGQGVLAQPHRLLQPGYLDHEIVHNWWGNGVFVDQREGNWSEALTTYCANYLWHERQGAEEAVAYRRRALLRYSVHAPANADYPLALFESKTTKLDDAVGYTKGSMVFHLLRRAVGDDVFWPTLREIAQGHIGMRVGWSTFIAAFAQRSGVPVDTWAGQWLQRAGAPQLQLAAVEVTPEGSGYTVRGEILQEGEPYTLTLSVRVDTTAGPLRAKLQVRGSRTQFSLAVPGVPLSVQIDPDADVFRRLPPPEQRPCLNRTLYSPALLCVYPEDPRDPRNATYRRLAERAAEERRGVAVPVSEVTARLLAGRSVIVFGHVAGHPRLDRLLAQARGVLQTGDTRFTLHGQTWERPTDAVLASVARTDDPALTLTIYAGNAPEALKRADLLFYYGWDSTLRFEAGRVVERQDAAPPRDALTWDGVAHAAGEPDAATIARTVETLADPWLLGRMTGQPESAQVQAHIVARFRKAGLMPLDGYRQEFTVDDPRVDVARPTMQLTAGRNAHRLPVWPVWWSAPAAAEGEVMFAGYGWIGAEWDDYRRQKANGRIVVAFGGGPPGGEKNLSLDLLHNKATTAANPTLVALRRQALIAQDRGAAGLLVVVPEDELAAYLPAIALPHPDLPWPQPRSPRGETAIDRVQAPLVLRAARLRVRAPQPPAPLRIPVWIMPWNPAETPAVGSLQLDRWRRRLAGGRTATVARVRRTRLSAPAFWSPQPRPAANIVGLLEGTDPTLKDEVIVVGAHYDHLGLADSGEVFRGADDNASGVAALLAVAEHLAVRRGELRRSVLFVAFDAEEWGLQGSRVFLEANVAGDRRIVAMVNADSIGRNIEDRVFIIGQTMSPRLGDVARRWAEAVGLTVGRDIDKFAYREGSDHWPFAEDGIPALTLFATDYATIDSVHDVPEALDYAHVARVTRLLTGLVYELASEAPADVRVPAAGPAPAPAFAPVSAPPVLAP